jgi:uncharacterized protein YjlB
MPSPNSTTPGTHSFADDDSIPNNLALPFTRYRGGIDLAGSPEPEKLIEKTFAENGSGEMLRNGMYPYARYRSTIHEAMGVARGRAKVRPGRFRSRGPCRRRSEPAGTGRQCLTQSPDLTVIGDYPPENSICAAAARPSKARRSPRSRKYRSQSPIRYLDLKGRRQRRGPHDL